MWHQRITLGEMRENGTHGLLVYRGDYKCSHLATLGPADVDKWPDADRPSDLEPRVVCNQCGVRGADVRADPTGGASAWLTSISVFRFRVVGQIDLDAFFLRQHERRDLRRR